MKKLFLSLLLVLGLAAPAAAQVLPNQCPAGKYAKGIQKYGSLTCSYLSDSDIPDGITLSTDGQLNVTHDPSTTSSSAASLRVNPQGIEENEKLLSLQNNGSDRLTVDAEGDAALFGDLTVSGTINGDLGSSVTVNELSANPADCLINQFATAIDESANLTCAAITDAKVPDDITINVAQTATALAANGANCNTGHWPLGTSAAGASESCSTAAYPSTAGSSGKFLISNATDYVDSTSTIPTSAGATADKVLLSDGTNYALSTPTFPNASATSGKFIRSDGTNWIASTPTLPTSAGSAGKWLRSDGTNYVESTATLPSTATGTGTILRADGTNWAATTATYPTTTTANQILYSSATSVVGEITTGNNKLLTTNGSGVPALGETYLESTCTPTVTLTGGVGNTVPVYSTNTCRYTQIGNRVFLDIFLSGDGGNEGAGTGQFTIALPVAVGASAAGGVQLIGRAINNTTTYLLVGTLSAGSSTFTVAYFSSISALATFTGAEQNNATRHITLRIVYEVD